MYCPADRSVRSAGQVVLSIQIPGERECNFFVFGNLWFCESGSVLEFADYSVYLDFFFSFTLFEINFHLSPFGLHFSANVHTFFSFSKQGEVRLTQREQGGGDSRIRAEGGLISICAVQTSLIQSLWSVMIWTIRSSTNLKELT
jgi:hypothetical protein